MPEQPLEALATQQLCILLQDPKLTRNQRLRALEVASRLLGNRGNDAPMIEGTERTELLKALGFGA